MNDLLASIEHNKPFEHTVSIGGVRIVFSSPRKGTIDLALRLLDEMKQSGVSDNLLARYAESFQLLCWLRSVSGDGWEVVIEPDVFTKGVEEINEILYNIMCRELKDLKEKIAQMSESVAQEGDFASLIKRAKASG